MATQDKLSATARQEPLTYLSLNSHRLSAVEEIAVEIAGNDIRSYIGMNLLHFQYSKIYIFVKSRKPFGD